MKKITLGQLAILGITSGVFIVAQGSVGLYADVTSFDASHMIAKPKCRSGPGGSCAGLVAMRDDIKRDAVKDEDDKKDEGLDENLSPENELEEDKSLKEIPPEERYFERGESTDYSESEPLEEATGDGYVKRDYQAPAFNKAGRTNVRMQNTEGR